MRTLLACSAAGVALAVLGLPSSGGILGQERSSRDPEVLTRGPIHEAFAQPVIRRPGSPPVVPRRPPEPVPELPPEQKPAGADVQWIPGYWAWEDEREDFVWVSGLWRDEPPGRRWVPGYWHQTDEGWAWVPGYWGPDDQTEVPLYPVPPDPIPEAVAPAPAEDSYYVPGCWVFQRQQYWWRPGFWLGYRPGWVWTPARYFLTPAGYVFNDGFWDHDFHRRGLLFAPALIGPQLLAQPGFSYRPSYALYGDFLLGSLFTRVAGGRYYFGDYYRPGYAAQGFVPWIDYRIGDRFQDPIYSYYRWQNRNEPRWDNQLRSVYAGRRDGKLPVPPRTLSQQKQVVGGNAIKIGAPVNQWRGGNIKLQQVTNVQIADHRREANQFRLMSQNRRESETRAQAAATGTAPISIKVDAPKGKTRRTTAKPPPAPTMPKFQGKPVPPQFKG
ncbi:MAG: hypothetical protein FJ271_29045 [Planctomycetes bacterium]|nr:hypothetical protein [Planctomycetota bacterium]